MRIQAPLTQTSPLETSALRPDTARAAPGDAPTPRWGAEGASRGLAPRGALAPDPWVAQAAARVTLANFPADAARLRETIDEVRAAPCAARRGPLTRLLSQARQVQRATDAMVDRLDERSAAEIRGQLPAIIGLRDALFDLATEGHVHDPLVHGLHRSLTTLQRGALEAQTAVAHFDLIAPERDDALFAYVPDGVSHYRGTPVQVVRAEPSATTPESAPVITLKVPAGNFVAFEVTGFACLDLDAAPHSRLGRVARGVEGFDGPGRLEMVDSGGTGGAPRDLLLTVGATSAQPRYARYRLEFDRAEERSYRARLEQHYAMD